VHIGANGTFGIGADRVIALFLQQAGTIFLAKAKEGEMPGQSGEGMVTGV